MKAPSKNGRRYPGLREFIDAMHAENHAISVREVERLVAARWSDPRPTQQIVSYHLQAVRKARTNGGT